MEPIYVAQLLDTKERFLIFYFYEIFAFIACLFGCYLLGSPVLGIISAFFSLFVCRHLRVKGYIDEIIPNLYWYFPDSISKMIIKSEGTPPSGTRVYTG